MRLIDAILHQFRIVSLPWWIVIGIVAICLFFLRNKREQIISNLLVLYIIVILTFTVLSREKMVDRMYSDLINLDLFGTWIQ